MTYPGYKEGGIVVCVGPEETHAEWYAHMKPKRLYTYHHYVFAPLGVPILLRRFRLDDEGNYVTV